MKNNSEKKHRLNIREMVLFSMLGTLMFCSKIVMEALPNIHLLGMLTIVFTLVFRGKALIPIYIYVFLNGLYSGFSMWWVPYTYIWTILWGITMLLPRKLSPKFACFVYPTLCALHGLAFGALYAPAQAIMFGFTFEQTVSWIIAGLTFDVLHCAGNFAVGLLILPLYKILKKLNEKAFA